MSFSYDLSTDVGKMRLRLVDTREAGAFFSDEELTVIRNGVATVDLAVADAARILLANVGRYARSFSGPDGSVDETAAATYLQDLIDRYGGATLATPTIAVKRLGVSPQEPTYYRAGVSCRC